MSTHPRGQSPWLVPGLSDQAAALWKSGHSASQIAKALNASYDGRVISRNAVMAKLDRMGLMGRVRHKASPPATLSAEDQPEKATAKPQTTLIMAPVRAYVGVGQSGRRGIEVIARETGPHGNDISVAPVAPGLGVLLLDLADGQCRMIISPPDAVETLFCGCRCNRNNRGRFESYCVPHKAVAVDRTPRAVNTRGIIEPIRTNRPLSQQYRPMSVDAGRRDYGF